MYRDEIAPAYERLRRVRAQLAAARTRPADEAMGALERQRRELARARRRVWRLRHPLLRKLPATFFEIGVVAGYGTLSLVFSMIVWLVVAAPFLALTTLRDRYALELADALPQVGDLDARRDLAVDGFRMFVNPP
jgi:hypothetical protein